MSRELAWSLGMRGYWINRSGSLTVTFYTPGLWERFVEGLLHDRQWVAYAAPHLSRPSTQNVPFQPRSKR